MSDYENVPESRRRLKSVEINNVKYSVLWSSNGYFVFQTMKKGFNNKRIFRWLPLSVEKFIAERSYSSVVKTVAGLLAGGLILTPIINSLFHLGNFIPVFILGNLATFLAAGVLGYVKETLKAENTDEYIVYLRDLPKFAALNNGTSVFNDYLSNLSDEEFKNVFNKTLDYVNVKHQSDKVNHLLRASGDSSNPLSDDFKREVAEIHKELNKQHSSLNSEFEQKVNEFVELEMLEVVSKRTM